MVKKNKKKQKSADLHVGQQFATARNDITIAGYTDVLDYVDDILLRRGGSEGLKVYDEIERDTHAYSVLQKRKHQLVAREWVVEPGGDNADDIAAADFVRDMLSTLPFDQICLSLLDATLKGFSVSEIIWAHDGRHLRPDRIISLDQRRFVFDLEFKPRLLTMQAPAKGEELPGRKFIVHRFGVKGNNPYGLGLGHRLFWPVTFKREGVGFWMKFLERFAAPIPVGKYPIGSTPAAQRDLMMVLQAANQASAITVPLGTELETFEGKRTGAIDYPAWGRFWNSEMSKAALGETLTTEMGQNGARAASDTHASILDKLVDSDADLLSGTLNDQLIKWAVNAAYPNAAPPRVWRPRPSNELQQEEILIKRAERRKKEIEVLATARDAGFAPKDEQQAMEDIIGQPVVTVEVAAQKKSPDVSFADGSGISIEQLLASLEAAVAAEHQEWLEDIRSHLQLATDEADFLGRLLSFPKSHSQPEYTERLGDAFALADLIGRSEVIDEGDDPEFTEPKTGTVNFTEMQDFLRQKVSLPTKTWTDTLHQAHDRAFVVAGADSVALVDDLRGALDKAIKDGGGLAAFREEFDAIVERTGWEYRGGRNWRTRVIYETNLRTAHQAGRLKQMRDPKIVKSRPYWRYVHAETRVPKSPRPQHEAWDGLVLRYDDPIWETIYPPNGWKCSCGVGTVSRAGLKRLGKSEPDTAPKLKMRKHKDPTTGELVDVPEAVDFGFGYAPGSTWERGLVPRELQKPLPKAQPELPLPVSPPLNELGRPFASPVLPAGKEPEFYVSRFLQRFGADVGRGVVHRDKSGHAIVVSDQLFQTASGAWKALKRGREIQMERLAEAIFDPDEIWVDWAEAPGGGHRLTRRYLRWDPELAAFVMFEWSGIGWSGVTAFDPRKGKANKPRLSYLENNRRGALIYRRET